MHESSEQDDGVVYVPLGKDIYGYEPYFFSTEELNELLSTEITKESLLDEIKSIVEDFFVKTKLLTRKICDACEAFQLNCL